MGLLNTTIIERTAPYVEYSRTHSHVKFAPEKIGIGFFVPSGMTLPEGYILAKAIVNFKLNLPVGKGKRRGDALPASVRLLFEGVCVMLVLSRHKNEQVIIGNDIVVTVVDIRGDKVRLGFDAPKEITVHRKEVYDAIKKENSGT